MNDQTDGQLLRLYAERRTEQAFAELVRRHVNFVYSAASRMVRDPHLAEDVTQGVFVALVKRAPQLSDRATLSGWLHQTAQNIAAQTIRTVERRRTREQEAAAMNQTLSSQTEASWEQIAPHLDAALGELTDADRDAVLLRYFEKKSAREIGRLLGVSDEAAQKRVSRAVERLREFFAKRGVTVGAGGLVIVITANAVQAAPAGLIATISASALLSGTAVSTAAVIAATKTIAMTTLQKTVIAAAIVATAGTGIFEAHQAAQLREQNQKLQQQQAPLAELIQQLQHKLDAATNGLSNLADEFAKASNNNLELLRLRGEIGTLRQQTNRLRELQQENGKLHSQVAGQSDMTNQVTAEDRFILQQTHATDAMNTLLTALENYADKNNGQYPVSVDQLAASGEIGATNLAGNFGLTDFEFAKDGTTNPRGYRVILELKVPIQKAGAGAVTISGCVNPDGKSETDILNINPE